MKGLKGISSFTETLKSWREQFQQYYFTYRQGFFHLPYNGDSPQSLVDSFDRLPFVQHSKEKRCVSSKNPFCEGGFYYHKLEEGCWIVYSRMRYKANVAFDLLYRSAGDERPVSDEDYYMLSLNNVNNAVKVDKDICKQYVCFPQYSWTFFKPKERHCDLNFKGADNKYITLYFNQTWLQENLVPCHLFSKGGLDKFIASDAGHIAWPLKMNEEVLDNFAIFEKVMNIGGDAHRIDLLQLKFVTLNFIFEFFKYCADADIINQHVEIDYSDKFSMSRVAHYLSNHLFEKFPGISFLAKKFAVSETKLKNEFRQLFGKTLYQFFHDLQMEMAKELVAGNQLLIKDVSYKFGYESPSKFSAAFKKYHNIAPSDALNTNHI